MSVPARRFRGFLIGGILALALGLAGEIEPARAKDRFPYTVYAAVDDTVVSSGPGEAFYTTDLLPKGSPLEVYRRDAGGWLAVRPPERSFCWVPARKLHVLSGDRTASVIADDAVAWIGSRVETVEDHRWQVRLERGERVTVLGHRELDDPRKGTTETWYQIAPPSGEFRWVHVDDVSRRAPRGGEASGRDGEDLAGQAPGPATAQDVPASATTAEAAGTGAAGDVQRAAGSGERSRTGSAVEPVQYRAEWSPRPAPRQARRLEPVSDAQIPPPTSSLATDREIEDLTLQLSLLAQREPDVWNLAPLRARAETLIERGTSPLERGKARLMLERIEEFEELQQKHIRAARGVPAAGTGTVMASAEPGGAGPGDTGGAAPVGTGLASLGTGVWDRLSGTSSTPRLSPSIEPRFDGTGWLLPVHSTKRVAPPYALLDDNGKVLQYVTPSPGLNLHRYERKRVGLYGQKGAAQSLNAPHLTAHRVVDLDRQARSSGGAASPPR
ncbi:MAG: hypothetical protein U0935_25535 [Pirellulales bacterium]